MNVRKVLLNEYQIEAVSFSIAPPEYRLRHAVSGLVSEIGEVARVLNKSYRVPGYFAKTYLRSMLSDELGDVAWFIAEIGTIFGVDAVYPKKEEKIVEVETLQALLELSFSSLVLANAINATEQELIPRRNVMIMLEDLWLRWAIMCKSSEVDVPVCLEENIRKLSERSSVGVIFHGGKGARDG